MALVVVLMVAVVMVSRRWINPVLASWTHGGQLRAGIAVTWFVVVEGPWGDEGSVSVVDVLIGLAQDSWRIVTTCQGAAQGGARPVNTG